MRLIYLIITGAVLKICYATDDGNESDGDTSRKILGSSVVTSVSVVMDTANKKNAIFTDAVGKPQSKPTNPSELASPIDLLNPDRYEFYTFDDNGDLVKRLMSLDEIRSIIATGDSDVLMDLDSFTSQGFLPEKRVSDVVTNVKSVVKDEMEILKDPISQPIFDTPDVSDTWSMILPAVFGNSGEDIKPEKPTGYVTPDTIMLEPSSHPTSGPQLVDSILSSTKQPTKRPSTPIYYSSTPSLLVTSDTQIASSTQLPLNVEIISNGGSTAPVKSTTSGMQPTRPPQNITTARPGLVRDRTKATTVPPTQFRPQTVATSIISKPTTVISSSFKPFSQKTSPSPTTVSPKPSSTSTKAKPSPNSTSVKPTPSSIKSPITSSSKPNIFGLSQDLLTSIRPSTSSSPALRPVSNIFGLPSLTELKNNPRPSEANPVKSTVSYGSSTSKITVKPQLSTSSTVDNLKKPLKSTSPTAATSTTWAPNPEDAQLFSVFKEVLGQALADGINASTASIDTTSEDSTTDSATINHILSFESNKISTTQTEFVEDLSTLPTETLQQNLPTTFITTSIPPLLSSLNDNQKLSASELLDQLLVTTNIYEINTELASPKQNATDADLKQETSTISAAEQDIISYPPTTDASLMQSIEQLLSQAVGDVGTIINETNAGIDNTRYSDVVISKEGESEISTSTEALLTSTIINNEGTTDDLSDSMGAILSQMTDKELLTEQPQLFVTNRRNDISETTTLQPSTTEEAGSTQKEEQESTTYYYVLRAKPSNTSNVKEEIGSLALQNLDFNRNRTKPAKSDLSLEQDFIAEEMTLVQRFNETTPDQLKESESTLISVKSNVTSEEASLIREEEIGLDTTTKDYPSTSTLIETTTIIDDTPTEDEKTSTVTSTETPATTTTKQTPRPSIVITLNNNNTLVTEHGKIVANKTISTPTTTEPAILKVEKNSTQDQTWTLVSTVAPQQAAEQNFPPPTIPYPEVIDSPPPVDLVPKPMQGFGLEESTSTLDIDVHQFVQLCNELAFGFWKTVTTGLSPARSIFVSPFAATSMLAMVFLGAKGSTSEEMNEILKLDDMVTFNPHLTFKSVSESIVSEPGSGIATTAIIRELFSDRSKGKLLDFYKNRVRAFYDGFVEEVSYREIGDVIRRRSNLLVKKYTNGKYPQFLNDASITARSPLSGVGINIFETDCSQTSTEGRDGELHFIVYPSIKQRRLVPVPAVVYKSGFLAGYEPSLDATAVALGTKEQVVSTILVVAGQQGIAAPVDGLTRLEKRLVESSFKKGAWSRLLRSLIPRPGLEVQIPRFSHKSVINSTNTLQKMGLHELFNSSTADLRGLNGVANELHLSDVLQINKFATCGEMKGEDAQHSEIYPATTMRGRAARRLRHPIRHSLDQEEPRDYQRAFHDPLHDPLLFGLPLSLRPRQARIPDVPRLRFDRPFLYFVRHNPTGLILHMGRFNPRLLP